MKRPDVTLVSEATIARLSADSVLHVSPPFIVTPSAADLAATRRIKIVEVEPADADTDVDALPADSSQPCDSSEADDAQPLAATIESTLLTADATPDAIRALCDEAAALGCYGVCVNPAWVALATERCAEHNLKVITVCGFPLGANRSEIKAAEARVAESQGAAEIDMVLPVGMLKAGDLEGVRNDIRSVRGSLQKPTTALKVIVEASLLSEEQIVQACVLAAEAGANFAKTGTGFQGPATVEMVALMARAGGRRLKIKAAGGIKTRAQAEAMLAAGACRIGTSSAGAVLG